MSSQSLVSYEAELQLEKAIAEFIADGTHLTPSPKLKSHLLERLAEEIIKFKVYPTDNDLNEVAEALVKQHPCLREQGSFNGCYGWKISLKYKMANVRTKLRGLGCAEVLVNSLKNKAQDKSQAALNVKKPRRAEVNYWRKEKPLTAWKKRELYCFQRFRRETMTI